MTKCPSTSQCLHHNYDKLVSLRIPDRDAGAAVSWAYGKDREGRVLEIIDLRREVLKRRWCGGLGLQRRQDNPSHSGIVPCSAQSRWRYIDSVPKGGNYWDRCFEERGHEMI